MEKIFEKIKKHGIISSLKIAVNILANYFCTFPDKIRIKIELMKSCNGMVIKNILGNAMVLDLNEVGISRELFITGVHEAESTKQIQEEIKPGMTIIEAGANIGYYSLIEAKIIGENGKIYAFEPSPVNMKLLKTNIALNSLEDNFETFPYGVGSKNEKRAFILMSKGNMSSFVPRREDKVIKSLGSINVKVVKLDDFWNRDLVSIDYVRMDVEGFEFEIVKGMKNILSSKNCPVGLFIEIHSELLNSNGSSCKAFLIYMAELGYEIKKARYRGKEKISVESMNELLNHSLRENGYWETFFIKNDRNKTAQSSETKS